MPVPTEEFSITGGDFVLNPPEIAYRQGEFYHNAKGLKVDLSGEYLSWKDFNLRNPKLSLSTIRMYGELKASHHQGGKSDDNYSKSALDSQVEAAQNPLSAAEIKYLKSVGRM